jgi:hypothetical protein
MKSSTIIFLLLVLSISCFAAQDTHDSENILFKNSLILTIAWKSNIPNIANTVEDEVWANVPRIGGGISYHRILRRRFSIKLSFDFIDNHDQDSERILTGFQQVLYLRNIRYRAWKCCFGAEWHKRVWKINISPGMGIGASQIHFNSTQRNVYLSEESSEYNSVYIIDGNNSVLISEIGMSFGFPFPRNVWKQNIFIVKIDYVQQINSINGNLYGYRYGDEIDLNDKVPPKNAISGLWIKGGIEIRF